jgi:protein phosphatase-4 regulatory subunit 3
VCVCVFIELIFLILLAALRFFRTIISSKDHFYHRHIVKEDLFRPIVEIFFENEHKYNLMNSAIIGLFEQIKTVLYYPLNEKEHHQPTPPLC